MSKFLPSLLCTMVALALGATTAFAETKPSLQTNDKKFVKDAAEASIAVLHMTEVVAREGSMGGEPVKTVCKAFSADLNVAWGELGTIAQAKGAELPKTDTAAGEKRQIEQMKKLSTDKFDKAFLKSLVKDTKKVAKVVEDGAKNVQDPELKAWAAKWAPSFKTHHEAVDQLENSESKKK
jgi:putative membrane protein